MNRLFETVTFWTIDRKKQQKNDQMTNKQEMTNY